MCREYLVLDAGKKRLALVMVESHDKPSARPRTKGHCCKSSRDLESIACLETVTRQQHGMQQWAPFSNKGPLVSCICRGAIYKNILHDKMHHTG
eukprot:SAG11_NODE_277_length_11302_cov_5.987146_4_plen_94_part_00